MHKMNALLVSMTANNIYRKNGSTDWRQRPECSHILSQLQTFMIKPTFTENELNLIDDVIGRKFDILYNIFIKSKPNCIIRMNNENTDNGNIIELILKLICILK